MNYRNIIIIIKKQDLKKVLTANPNLAKSNGNIFTNIVHLNLYANTQKFVEILGIVILGDPEEGEADRNHQRQ
jgi:hypothetical protein